MAAKKTAIGLLVLIVHSQMLEAATSEDLKNLLEEAREEMRAAEMDLETAEDAMHRLEDKLAKAKAEVKARDDFLNDCMYIVDTLQERLEDGRPAMEIAK